MRSCLLCGADRQVQLEKGDTAAQELVNSLQVLEVMAGAMAAELKSLVRPLPCMLIVLQAGMIGTWEDLTLTGALRFHDHKIAGVIAEVHKFKLGVFLVVQAKNLIERT